MLGLDAIGTGLAFLPTPVVIGLISLLVAPRVTARFGARPVLLAGLGLLVAGLVLLVRVPVGARYAVDVLPPLVIMGLGIGVVIPAVIMLAMAGAEPRETGLVSGLTNTAQQAGAALGLAVLAVVAARVSDAGLAAGVAEVTALRDGYGRAYLTAAGFALGALVITALVLRDPAGRPSVPAGGRRSAPAGGRDGGDRPVDAGAGAGDVRPVGRGARTAGGDAVVGNDAVVGGDAVVRAAGGGVAAAPGPVALEPPLCRK